MHHSRKKVEVVVDKKGAEKRGVCITVLHYSVQKSCSKWTRAHVILVSFEI